jgi:hypothetical protein
MTRYGAPPLDHPRKAYFQFGNVKRAERVAESRALMSSCHTAPALHFVGFRGDEYWSAVRIWGRPDFIHRRWDQRARREISPDDVLIFATGSEADPPSRFNGDDLDERYLR